MLDITDEQIGKIYPESLPEELNYSELWVKSIKLEAERDALLEVVKLLIAPK